MPNDQRIHRQTVDESKKDRGEALPTTERRDQEKRVRVALVHDWLNGMRGGEIVFEAMVDLYPTAEIFTLIYEPEKLSKRLRDKLNEHSVHSSFLNRFAFSRKYYRQLLPLLPFAIQTLNLEPYDLVISSSHCVAKGIKKNPNAIHLSYIHAPMRYMWNRFDDYFGPGRIFFLFRWIALFLRPLLQAWDKRTSQADRVDILVANSNFIAEQIRQNYGRAASTVYPFAELARFKHPRRPGNYYLMVTAFAPYKRTDLAIEAFARMGLPLKVVGHGQEEERLHALKEKLGAKNIEFVSRPSNEQIERYYSECKAFIFPGTEDFGITPLEAMASGAPVIAFGEGGACETVTPETGILFSPQTVDALCDAVLEIESGRKIFSSNACESRAAFFNRQRFTEDLTQKIQEKLLK